MFTTRLRSPKKRQSDYNNGWGDCQKITTIYRELNTHTPFATTLHKFKFINYF